MTMTYFEQERELHFEMLRRSGGRSFEELQELVGHHANVSFSDYGADGERHGWQEAIVIQRFVGPVAREIFDEEGFDVGRTVEPQYEVRCSNGMVAFVFLNDLANIRN